MDHQVLAITDRGGTEEKGEDRSCGGRSRPVPSQLVRNASVDICSRCLLVFLAAQAQ